MDESIKGRVVVVDASVFLAWLLREDKEPEEIEELLKKHRDQEQQVMVPPLIRYEVINSLKSAVVRRRLTSRTCYRLLKSFEKFLDSIQLQESKSNVILNFALKFDISGYDAAYVALAKNLKTSLITRDRKLAGKIGKSIRVEVI